jgi:uncharacterized protein YggU (UPF0235/DUF167 family)
MKKVFFITLFLTCHYYPGAQTAVDVLNKISGEFTLINKKFVEYQSASAHGSSAQQTEQKRQQLLNQVTTSRQVIADGVSYKGDSILQTGILDFLKLVEYNMNEDYEKLVDFKEISEQSYDKMEAYILIKNQVSDKMENANKEMIRVQKEYCKKYNITLVEGQTELEKQIETINQVGQYTDKLQLIFMKCSFLNDDLAEAIEKKNINETEQLRSAMQKFADEGIRILDTIQAFKGDRSLINACRKSMVFFQQQAIRSTDFTDLFTLQENFNRIKKQFDADKAMQNDKDAVKKYNDAVASMNRAVNNSNRTLEYINNSRKETYDNWNNAVKLFLDKHVPMV